MAHPEPRDDWQLKVETCRIELWRGYLTSTFVARLLDGEDAGAVVGSSSSFRCRSSRPPETEEARLAHYELVSQLKGGGWSPNDAGGEWYATELARPTLVPPPAPAEAPPAPVPVPEPAPAPAAVAPPPAPPPPTQVVHEPPTRDRWRPIAAAGLLAAVLLLVFLALHGPG